MEQKYLDLIEKARTHDQDSMEELLQVFKPKVIAIAREYFLVGADFDDLIQEGMIGLYKAIIVYDGEKNHNFGAFASLCIHRQIQNAVKNANRKKNVPLNQYIPINYMGGVREGEGDNQVTRIIRDDSNFETEIVMKEANAILLSRVSELLSQEQFELLTLFLNGETYQNIAIKTGKTSKQVDNMLQAIKKKLRTIKGEV